MYNVLSVAYDLVLLNTRAMILREEGYRVNSAQNRDDAVELPRHTSFDVLIICHGLPVEHQRQIATAFRKSCPDGRIVALVRRHGERAPLADRSIEAHKPEELVAELRRMLVRNFEPGTTLRERPHCNETL